MPSIKPATSYTSCSLAEPVKIRGSPESFEELKPRSIPEWFHECCEKYKHLPALSFEKPSAPNSVTTVDNWTTLTFEEYEKNVEQAALALLYLGVPARSSVGILAFNCPEWFYVNFGCIRINAVSAGVYTTNSAEAVFHVLDTSDASVVVVDDTQQLKKVRAIRSRLPQLRAVVQLNGPFDFEEADRVDGYYRWPDLFAMNFNSSLRDELKQRESEVAANYCASLIFTSGTVGMPKAVMISHDGILSCTHWESVDSVRLLPGQDTMVSFLPLNHIAAQLCDMYMAVENGLHVYFADRNALKGTLIKTFGKAKPTMVTGVPRIFEKIQEKIIQVEENSSRITRCVMTMARATMLQYHLDKMEGKPTSALKYWLASKLINRIKMALGLDHGKYCFIGGAPVSQELKSFYLSLDVPLMNIYGMSETSGGVIIDFDRPNMELTGRALKGVEVKILKTDNDSGEGEVLLRGRTNMMGYLKDLAKTEETISEDGWLYTGDLAHMDAEGNIYICGRIKDLIITAGGENIPPTHIEELIKKELPCISNAVVIGDKRKYLTVLLTLKTKINADTGYPMDELLPETTEWLESLGFSYTKLSEVLHVQFPENFENFDPNLVDTKLDDEIHKALEAGIQRANKEAISRAQCIQYFKVLPHDFSIPTNELGPTLKIRRNIIQTKYAQIIEQMYKK